MKNKSDTPNALNNYIIKTKYDRCIQILHTDNGSEYINSEFKKHFSKNGITVEKIVLYTPEQNSRAERNMRTIVESARAMLYNADIPLEFWAEAINTAVYILNRILIVQASNSTSLEFRAKKISTLSHIRTFGAEIYVFIPDTLRKKTRCKE